MKKLLIVLMVLALTLTGCEAKSIAYDNGEKVIFGNFVVLEILEDPNDGWVYIMYDKETKVEYYYILAYNRAAMSPIYNADGTVKIYEGE